MPTLPSPILEALRDALTLVLPVDCAGCGAPDTTLCTACSIVLSSPAPTRRRIDEGVVVWSGVPFDGVAARVLRALKEEGRTGLARALAPALAAAVERACAGEALPVVPIPTSRASFRRRGFRVPDLVARSAGLQVVRLLAPSRPTADQRGLDRDARRRNVAGSLVARHPSHVRRVVVVDDVVTTGATLAEAVRALQARGVDVVGCATVAATPLRSRPGDVFANRT